MSFTTPQINLCLNNLEISKAFYQKLWFKLTFTAEMEEEPVHHELVRDGFILGIATK